MTTREVTFFVQLEPEIDRYSNGDVVITDLKAARMTQRYPSSTIKAGCLVVKLTLRVPSSRLLPLAPDPFELPEADDYDAHAAAEDVT